MYSTDCPSLAQVNFVSKLAIRGERGLSTSYALLDRLFGTGRVCSRKYNSINRKRS